MKKIAIALCIVFWSCGALWGQTPPPNQATPQPSTTLAQTPAQPAITQEELDTALAPIALYPDPLLAQLLMASTYPEQVKEAAAWSKAHPSLKGDEALKAVEKRPWDPSVASLVAFPQVLDMMGQKPEWVQSLGELFLADPDAVMSTIQTLRKKAYDAGKLKESKEQKVIVKQENAPTQEQNQTVIIEIQPADPQVVYIPIYDPGAIFGPWWYPTPPFFYHPPHYHHPFAEIIGWGAAIIVSHALWSHWDWHHHDININVNHFNQAHPQHQLHVARPHYSWREKIRPKNPHLKDLKRRKQITQPAVKPTPVLNDRMARPGEKNKELQRERAKEKLENNGMELQHSRETLKKEASHVDQAIHQADKMAPAIQQKPTLKPKPAAPRPAVKPAATAKPRPAARPKPKPSARPKPAVKPKPRPSVRPRPKPQPAIRPKPMPRPAIKRPAPMPRISRPKMPSAGRGAVKAMHR